MIINVIILQHWDKLNFNTEMQLIAINLQIVTMKYKYNHNLNILIKSIITNMVNLYNKIIKK